MTESKELVVDAALGGPWDVLGDLIKQSGKNDSSGFRRMLAGYLESDDYEFFSRALFISRQDFAQLRKMFVDNQIKEHAITCVRLGHTTSSNPWKVGSEEHLLWFNCFKSEQAIHE